MGRTRGGAKSVKAVTDMPEGKKASCLDAVFEDHIFEDKENAAPANNIEITSEKEKTILGEKLVDSMANLGAVLEKDVSSLPMGLTVDISAANSDATSSTAASTPTSVSAATPLSDSGVTVASSLTPVDASNSQPTTPSADGNNVALTLDSFSVVSSGVAPPPPPPAAAPVAPWMPPGGLPLPPRAAPAPPPAPVYRFQTYRDRLRQGGLAAMRRGPIWRPIAASEDRMAGAWMPGGAYASSLPPAQALGLMTHSINSTPTTALAATAPSFAQMRNASMHSSPCGSPYGGSTPVHGGIFPPMPVHSSPCGSPHGGSTPVNGMAPHMPGGFMTQPAPPQAPLDLASFLHGAQFPPAFPATMPTLPPPPPAAPAVLPERAAVTPTSAQEDGQRLLSLAFGNAAFPTGLSGTEMAEQLRAAAAASGSYED